MASAERKETVEIVLKLTEQEAEVLCALTGGLDGKHGGVTFDIYQALDEALPNRESTFSDHFEFRTLAPNCHVLSTKGLVA